MKKPWRPWLYINVCLEINILHLFDLLIRAGKTEWISQTNQLIRQHFLKFVHPICAASKWQTGIVRRNPKQSHSCKKYGIIHWSKEGVISHNLFNLFLKILHISFSQTWNVLATNSVGVCLLRINLLQSEMDLLSLIWTYSDEAPVTQNCSNTTESSCRLA